MISDEIISGPIGEAMVKMGEMTQQQVDKVLEIQKGGDKRLFGEIAVDLDYMDLMTVIRYLEGEHREDEE